MLLTRLKDPQQCLAYAQSAITHGWSRNMLDIHIETRLLELGAGFAFVGRQVLLDVGGEINSPQMFQNRVLLWAGVRPASQT